MKHAFLSILLLVSVSATDAVSLKVGINCSGMIPLVGDDTKEYDLTYCFEPFGEVIFSNGFRLSIALGYTMLDEDHNWWAEGHRETHLYDYSYTANEKTVSILLKECSGNLFFGAGMCHVRRGFTAEMQLASGGGYFDSNLESSTGLLFSSGFSSSSTLNSSLDVVLQARIYGNDEIWLVLGTSLGFVLFN